MYKLNHIKLNKINKLEGKLVKFSHINEHDIRDLWYLHKDEYLDDFSQLVYKWDAPLYQKMIFRFRNGNNKATTLYMGCDPCNKQKLMFNYELYESDINEIIYFFGWLTNSLNKYEINEILSLNDKDSLSKNEALLRNDIVFFFSLSNEQRNLLINKYNIECVDKFNDFK